MKKFRNNIGESTPGSEKKKARLKEFNEICVLNDVLTLKLN